MADEARAAGHPVFAYIDGLRGHAILLITPGVDVILQTGKYK